MKLSMLSVWLFGWLWLTGLVAVAQDERTYQAFSKQGKRYEEQGNYKQALESYKKALLNASAENRPALSQTITRLEGLARSDGSIGPTPAESTAVDQAKVDELQRKISSLTRPQERRRLQDDLNTLQQRGSLSVADYQGLLRKIDAARQVESALKDAQPTETVVNASTPPTTTKTSVRTPANSKINNKPPPKVITISMPDVPPADAQKSNRDIRGVKSAKPLLNGKTPAGKSN